MYLNQDLRNQITQSLDKTTILSLNFKKSETTIMTTDYSVYPRFIKMSITKGPKKQSHSISQNNVLFKQNNKSCKNNNYLLNSLVPR